MRYLGTYGEMAAKHMQRWQPTAYASIPLMKRESYFLELNEAVVEAIRCREHSLRPPASLAQNNHQEYVAQINMAHLMAEEAVLAEMVLLPPEPGLASGGGRAGDGLDGRISGRGLAFPEPGAQRRRVAGSPDGDGLETGRRNEAAGTAAGTTNGLGPPAGEWRARSPEDLAPAGHAHRLAANIEALQVLRRLERAGQPATSTDQAVLARWSSWGSLPQLFDESDVRYARERAVLSQLLDEREWAAAARTTLNAHYTDFDVASAVWNGVAQAGLLGGRVLEPGVGSGTFLATVPEGLSVEVVGVEVDPVTAAIAKALHPSARIRAESFAVTRFPNGWFDLAIGNVPFGDYRLFDPFYNRSGLFIHNHFIVKSLRLVREGGYVAVLTSRFTLDAAGVTARTEMGSLGDLVGALRLPQGAMRRVAGTDVAMDLLLLRRRPAGAEPAGEEWGRTVPIAMADGTTAQINEVFARNPDWVLGELRTGQGQYGQKDIEVRPLDGTLAPRLTSALATIVSQAASRGLGYAERPTRAEGVTRSPRRVDLAVDVDPVGDAPGSPHHVERSLLKRTGGGFAIVRDGITVAHSPPRSQADELGLLIDLRDSYFETIDAQAAVDSETALLEARARLNNLYDRYVAAFGPINRCRLLPTGRHDIEGHPIMARRFPPMGGFNADPGLAVVRALEIFDDETGTATKAAIFDTRILAPRHLRPSADSPEDALALCLDECGAVDVGIVARLLDCPEDEARHRLGTLVYDDARDGPPLTATQYLSGDVRSRLAEARAAAARDPRWAVNVAALEAVQPRDLEPSEIEARLGAPWIPPGDISDFCSQVLEADVLVEYAAATGEWVIAIRAGSSNSIALTSEWGTSRANAIRLVEANANQRLVTVTDETPDGQRITNLAETLSAREKQEAITERFSSWVWEDPGRADRLAAEYNRRFNSLVLPSYDGSHLRLPGLATNFRPHTHQRDAVWRILSEPTVLLAHGVGAGKTATMVMAGREMKRLGMVSKPAYVVPNHMLEQFSREYLQLYPQAKVLVANRDDISPAQRKEFVARCAAEDWDAVIMTHAGFERVPVSAATEREFLEARIADLRASIDASNAGGKGLTVKNLEKVVARVEERHKALIADARRDQGGVCFEATGIDYLYLDEAHAYKNLAVTSRTAGVRTDGSKRAEDMAMKLDWLRKTHGHRVATLATATPIANSISEMYVMQRYLAPDGLAAAGVEHFDGWAANFGRTITTLELAPDSASYRMTTRFARFANVPDLLRMFRSFADVRTGDDLHLAVPDLAGGRPETLVVPACEELKTYVAELAERAEAIRNRTVRPEEDNMLKVSGDGRKAALDLRLVDRPADVDGGKLAAAASVIARIHRDSRDHPYLGDDRARSARRGGLQLVFCDLGTPKADGEWSAYEQLRCELVDRGVPAESVRFIHEARNDMEKARLFAAARAGSIAVLVGSTEKMGIGTNVQARAIALHHIDCPWRPADLEQREGRILRQGNQNAEVRIIRYVTEGSFDVFSWQTVERKAAFINQLMRGEVTQRSIDDVGDQALSYAEVKALATGNPLIMESAGVEAELTKLDRLQAAHRHEQANLARRVAASEREATDQDAVAAAYRSAASRAVDTSGDHFRMIIDGQTFSKRTEAAAALQVLLVGAFRETRGPDVSVPVGHLAGFNLVARVTRDSLESSVSLSLDGIPRTTPATTFAKLRNPPPLGMLTRVENLAGDLESRAATASERAEQARRDAARATGRIGQAFEHTDRIANLRSRLVAIDKELAPAEPAAGVPSPPGEKAPEVQDLARVLNDALRRKRKWELMAPSSVGSLSIEAGSDPHLTV